MTGGSASNPFSIFDQLTEARAAMTEEVVVRQEAGIDPARVAREKKRRAKGQLRAREHPTKRPHNGVERLIG